MRGFAKLLACAMVAGLTIVVSASTAVGSCGEDVDLDDAHRECHYTQESLVEDVATSSDRWRLERQCDLRSAGQCATWAVCADGTGRVFDVFRNDVRVGSVCLTDLDPADIVDAVGAVLRAWRSLTWPQSELSVQPPGGETLVNFDTNLYTTNDRPSVQTVSLLGMRFDIQATPTTYLWVHGDGTTAETQSPGAAYPALPITHDYRTAGTVHPRVDTVYTGRYRIGTGAWHDIPDPLTVAGTAVTLRVLEATPQLVGSGGRGRRLDLDRSGEPAQME